MVLITSVAVGRSESVRIKHDVKLRLNQRALISNECSIRVDFKEVEKIGIFKIPRLVDGAREAERTVSIEVLCVVVFQKCIWRQKRQTVP